MKNFDPIETLGSFCAGFPLKDCYRASGRVGSVDQGTSNTVPRIFMPINAPVAINIPQHHRVASYKLQIGDALLMPPHLWNQSSGGKSFLVIFFAHNHCRILVWHRKSEMCSQSFLLDSVPVVSRLAIQAALGSDDTAIIRDLMQASMRAVLMSAKQIKQPINESRQRWLEIIDWLDDHFHESIDRNDVARLFNMHSNHLSRLFRQHGNERFNAYLIRKRVEHATHLLRNSDLPIAEIGACCGYPSPAAFAAIIRRSTGHSPSILRNGV